MALVGLPTISSLKRDGDLTINHSYFDSDSIIMNEEIPLEIFEPPSDFDHINWIAGKDWNGLNAGVFLLRVCP